LTTSKHQAVIDMEYTLWQLGLNPKPHSTEAEAAYMLLARKRSNRQIARSFAKAVYNGE